MINTELNVGNMFQRFANTQGKAMRECVYI
jgi:hypothetical protein